MKTQNKTIVPEEFRPIFWDCDFDNLYFEDYPKYVAARILKYGNNVMLIWLFDRIDRNFLKRLLKSSRELDERTINYWDLMLNAK